MTPANRIGIPAFIIGLCFFAMAHLSDNQEYAWVSIPFIVFGILTYILAPQINWWFYQRKAPEMPTGLRKLFEQRIEFYQQLHPRWQKKFRDRVMLFMEANDFRVQNLEEVPKDIQMIISASAVQLTIYRDTYLFDKFENVIIYPHPFPSPQFPENWHVCEHYEEDGVLMFCADHLMKGFFNPRQYFPVGLYEYANVFQRLYPHLAYPKMEPSDWQVLKKIHGFGQEEVKAWIGLPEVSLLSTAIVNFMLFPEQFTQLLPQYAKQLSVIFRPEES